MLPLLKMGADPNPSLENRAFLRPWMETNDHQRFSASEFGTTARAPRLGDFPGGVDPESGDKRELEPEHVLLSRWWPVKLLFSEESQENLLRWMSSPEEDTVHPLFREDLVRSIEGLSQAELMALTGVHPG